jgi:hypothetical protein
LITRSVERAQKDIAAGSYKKALEELWLAEAHSRSDPPQIKRLIPLVETIAVRAGGRTQRDAELLASTLRAGLDSTEPKPPALVSIPPSPLLCRLGLVLASLALVSFAAGALGINATFFDSGFWANFWVYVLWLSLACAAASIAAGLACLAQRRRRRA